MAELQNTPYFLSIETMPIVEETVTSDGGTVVFPDNSIEIEIPAGALEQDTPISIGASSLTPEDRFRPVTEVFTFGPDNIEFSKPIKVKFNLEGLEQKDTRVYWSEKGNPEEFKSIGGTLVGNTLEATVDHFSNGFVGQSAIFKKIRGTLNVSRRVNAGFSKKTLSENFNLSPLAHAWYSLDPDTEDRIVVLPDAAKILEGWSVVIHHNGGDNAGKLVVVDNSQDYSTPLKIITSPATTNDTKAYQFVLINNGTSEGQWKVIELGDPTVKAEKYQKLFLEGDWSEDTVDLLKLEIPGEEHEMGTTPSFEVLNSNDKVVRCFTNTFDEQGNIKIQITEDDEFDGSVIIW